MATIFKKVVSGILKGAGSVLSVVPGIGPLVGPSLMAAGGAMYSKSSGTADIVTAAAQRLTNSVATAQTMTQAGQVSTVANPVMDFVKQNLLIIIGGAVAVMFIIMKSKKR